jgi:hypothetical protein
VYAGKVKSSAKAAQVRDERAERLAAALRENLKRRKAQARAQQNVGSGAAKDATKEKAPSK